MTVYYAISVLLSAFLLFQVQPMIGKYILPWFGGTPAVWSTVLLFFQASLTAGYAYAYWLHERLRERLQGLVHLILLGVSLVVLLLAAWSWPSPLTPDAGWRPLGSASPIWGVFRVLAISVGLPYFLLSTNSTLMQAWYNRDQRTQAPYRLYALSNAGSLLALISYPIVFEPNLTLRAQGYLWAAAYGVFAILAGYLAFKTYQRTSIETAAESKETASRQLREKLPRQLREAVAGEDAQPSTGVHALWMALAACATALLIAVTSQITQEVAVIPFLWILPLTIYLLTFILAFSGGRFYSRRLYGIAFFVIGALSVWMLVKWPPFSILVQIAIYTLLLFVCCMICHSELFKLRPHPRYLPSFYLMTALGGAIGGIFVNLLAPHLFSTGFWELQWAFIGCGVLLTVIVQSERAPAPRTPRAQSRRQRKRKSRQPEVQEQRRRLQPVAIVSAVAVLLLCVAIVLIMREISSQTLLALRSFYGVSRVWEINTEVPAARAYQLTHGKTVHGFQFVADELRDVPTTFYAESSGVGLAILNHPARPGPLRVGALGMGIGVIASYGQPGDVFRFYEINPDVIRIAEGEGGYFSFLSDSQADVQVIPGDARVSLERELLYGGSQQFDLLVLDAFSGDTIPLHLLTQEAFDIYLQHLKPDGIMAIHVSNRYFDLYLEGYRLADAFDLATALIQDRGDGLQSYDSIWMLLTRQPDSLEQPAIAERSAQRPAIPAGLRLWTDDYSNLLQILR